MDVIGVVETINVLIGFLVIMLFFFQALSCIFKLPNPVQNFVEDKRGLKDQLTSVCVLQLRVAKRLRIFQAAKDDVATARLNAPDDTLNLGCPAKCNAGKTRRTSMLLLVVTTAGTAFFWAVCLPKGTTYIDESERRCACGMKHGPDDNSVGGLEAGTAERREKC